MRNTIDRIRDRERERIVGEGKALSNATERGLLIWLATDPLATDSIIEYTCK